MTTSVQVIQGHLDKKVRKYSTKCLVLKEPEHSDKNVFFSGDSGFPGLPGKTLGKWMFYPSRGNKPDLIFLFALQGPPGQIGHSGLDGPRGPKGNPGNRNFNYFI